MKKLALTILSMTLVSLLSGCEMLSDDATSYRNGSYGSSPENTGYRGGRASSGYVPDEEKYQMIKSTIDSHRATLGDKDLKTNAPKEEEKKKVESQPQSNPAS